RKGKGGAPHADDVIHGEAQPREAFEGRTRLADLRWAAGAAGFGPSTSRTEEAVAARAIHPSSVAASLEARMRASSVAESGIPRAWSVMSSTSCQPWTAPTARPSTKPS